jgi:acyl carrier protein
MAGALTGASARRLRAAGSPPLTTSQGLALFDAALATAEPYLVPLGPGLTAFTAGQPGQAGLPPLFRGLDPGIRAARPAAASGQADAADLIQQLTAMPPAQRPGHLITLVRTHAAAVLGYPTPSAVDPANEFRELGFDSLTAVELRNRLSAATGLRLSATFVFDYPNPIALASHLVAQLVSPESGPAPISPLAELDRLEAVLAVAAPDDTTRSGVTLRLQQLLDKWRAAEASGPAGVADQIELGSTDEIFDFIDHQLGRVSDQ